MARPVPQEFNSSKWDSVLWSAANWIYDKQPSNPLFIRLLIENHAINLACIFSKSGKFSLTFTGIYGRRYRLLSAELSDLNEKLCP